MEDTKEKYIVEGFEFLSKEDADRAIKEKNTINYILRASTNENSESITPEKMLNIYNTLSGKKIFKTPVGYVFIYELQDYLKKQKGIPKEKIQNIIIDKIDFPEKENKISEGRNPVQKKIQNGKDYKKLFHSSVFLNIALVLMIITMFIITFHGKSTNIINYENQIIDRYAAWEKELTERENELKEREEAWKLQP